MNTLDISYTSSPSSAPNGSGGNSKDSKKPFKIRANLLAPTRLAPKTQLLHYARAMSIQVIAHEAFLLVLACSKCFAVAGKQPPQIGILGGGSVGTTVAMTLLANGYRAERIALSTRQPDRIPRCEALKAPSALPLFQLVPRYYDNARLARESDVLVVCMPPAQLKSVTIQIRHALSANASAPPLLISALCGVTHQHLSKACGSQAVVRVQPDVVKIASQWNDEQEQQKEVKILNSIPPSRVQTPIDSALEHALMLQKIAILPLPLRLAVEAIAPRQDDVCNLLQAFSLFCRRAWGPEVRLEELSRVLFGDKSELAMTTLSQRIGEDLQLLQQENNKQVKTPLVGLSYPAEWEQDLVLLQTQLAANAIQ